MKLKSFCERLNTTLQIDEYTDVDGNANGLQVGKKNGSVHHSAFAVDAAQATIDAAVEADADVLVTHHGLFWEGTDRITKYTYDRVAALIEADLDLYVAHLPLDGHQELGNAAQIAGLLGLDNCEPFGSYGNVPIGQQGVAAGGLRLDDLVGTLATELEGAIDIEVLDFGAETVEQVGIVTGAGVDSLESAADAGLDVLITGEGKQHAYHLARELEVNLVLAGHYATETTGVKAVSQLVAEWGVETTYLSHPMPL